MRLRHIEVFHAIYTCGSMTRAAELLNVSQPSVSKVLAHAELQIGFPLFDRKPGKLVPTPEAERLFPHIVLLFENLSATRRVAANLRDAADGKIRIASTPALGIELMPELVATYMSQQPATLFDLQTLHYEEIANALTESRIDLGLAFDARPTPGIAQETLSTGSFVLVAPKNMRLAGKPPYSIPQVAQMPLIQLHVKSPLGQLLQSHFEHVSEQVNIVAVTETYQIATALAAKGVGVTVVDEITARAHAHADIQILPLDSDLDFSVDLMYLAQSPLSMVCQRFVKHVHENLAIT